MLAVQQQHGQVHTSSGTRGHELLVHKLYKYKLEALLKDLATTLSHCSLCAQVFSLAERARLQCPAATAAALDEHASSASGSAPGHRPPQHGCLHQPDLSWRYQEYLAQLRAAKVPWRSIYWHAWGQVHVLYCHHCMTYFPAAEVEHCRYHPRAPLFLGGQGAGKYPCCGAPASRLATFLMEQSQGGMRGCCSREHQVRLQM